MKKLNKDKNLNKTISPEVFKWIDLTHELSENNPTWSGSCGFQLIDVVKYEDFPEGCRFLVQRIDMSAGVGTHMDAPAHCFPGGKTVAEIPLQSLISPCVVIDVSEDADEDYRIDMPVIEAFENEYGKIGKSTFVIFYTGWEKFWNKPDKYRNDHRFPFISKEVAEYLISKDIAGIGIDTLSPDRANDGFPVHQVVLGAGKYIIENIANASQMPPVGGYSFAMPLKTTKGTEAPIRLIGMRL